MCKKVSVIIPSYNVEEYIENCLESACAQSYDNLQIIVVDDGSTDSTFDKIKLFSERDDRILAIHKENGGVSSARNFGLSKVEGDYVTFLDADDELENNAIHILVERIEKTNADVVSFQYSRWDKEGNRLEDVDFVNDDFDFSSNQNRVEFIAKELVQYRVGVEACIKFFKSAIIKENNLSFPENCRIGEDFAFTLKYILHSNKLVSISDKLYRYNNRSNSVMNTSREFGVELTERVVMLEDVWKHVNEMDNEIYRHVFPVIFVMIINNNYIGHNADEVSEQLKTLDNITFVKAMYEKLPKLREEYFMLDNCEIARIRYRYHMYIRSVLNSFTIGERITLSLYDLYRSIRGQEKLESWIMPY